MVRLTLTCSHGKREVELPNEEPPSDEYAMRRLFALQPRCPYCDPLNSEDTLPGPSIEKRVRYQDFAGVRDA